MCRILSVSRSGFYSWLHRGKSKREQDNKKLLFHITQIHTDSHRIYGSPRITAALRQCGIKCNHKRVARLMRLGDIRSKIKRKFKVTTHSAHRRPVAPNLVKDGFNVPRPNLLWTSDITYIWTKQGWLYLAVFLDAYSRRIVGWAMSQRLTDRLILRAFKQALGLRHAQAGLVVHSDRGSQYCSRYFKELLSSKRYLQSMSSPGNWYQNAITESFFASLKTELVYHETYQSRDQAQKSIFKYIEMFYNRKRIHSALGEISPEQFENSVVLA
jgi:putative transposase